MNDLPLGWKAVAVELWLAFLAGVGIHFAYGQARRFLHHTVIPRVAQQRATEATPFPRSVP